MDRLLRVPPSKVQPSKIQRWSDYLFKFCGKKTINRSLESCSTHLKAAVEHKGTIHQPFLRWVSAEGGPFDQHGEGGCDPVQGEKGLAWTRALHLEQSMAPATRNQTLGLAESVMVKVALHVCAAFSCPPIFAPWVVPIYQHVNVCKCTPIMAEMLVNIPYIWSLWAIFGH